MDIDGRYVAIGGGAVILALLAMSGGKGRAGVIGPRRWPVSTYRGTISGFGARRTRPDGTHAFHAAADVGALPGDRVIAIEDGIVLYPVSGFSLGAGLQAVAIRHGDSEFIYAEIHVEVKSGERVVKGQRIGVVAKNGDGTSMLHLEQWALGKAPHGFVSWNEGQPKPDGLIDVSATLASGAWDKSPL